MKHDRIVVEKGFFVQLVVSLIMTGVYIQEFLQSVWRLPVMVFLVLVVNMYFNALSVAYGLKAKSLKLKWCFVSSFSKSGFGFFSGSPFHIYRYR